MQDCKYKYEFVTDALRENIRNGIYPTGKLPEEKELMVKFRVGKKTVYNALKQLSSEGIIKRIKSKGTFIDGILGRSVTVSGQVAVAMRYTGHYYSTLAMMIRKQLAEKSLLTVPVDYSGDISERKENLSRDNLFLLLNSSIYGVVYDGDGYWMLPFLKDFPQVRSVCINNFDAPGDIPGSAVLIDYEAGVYDTVRYLASKGRKKIMCLTYKPKVFPIEDKFHFSRHPVNQTIEGYSRAMKAEGLSENIDVVYKITESLDDQIRGILSRKNRPDAIICSADNLAVKVIINAMIMGIDIPHNLAVVGMYNTPWCEEAPIKISSLSFKENEIAALAVDLITQEKSEKKIIKIKPELIKRESA
jgi:DNA-binding LacI/PurR family transcriptional regulator